MRKVLYVVQAILLTHSCMSQVLRSPLSTRYIGTGVYSKSFTDVFSFTANQAALSQVKDLTAGVYSERRFMLKELSLYSAAVAMPFKDGAAGASINYSGFKDYSESQVGLAYGRLLTDRIDLGLQFNYYSVRIAGYGNTTTINCEIGALIHASEKVRIGIHAYNPIGVGSWGSDPNEKPASVYTMGLGFEASEKLLLSAELGKEQNEPVNVNIALQYAFIEQFIVRGGIATGSNNSYLGAGIRWKTLTTNFIGTYHPQLGFTPSLLIIFGPGKTKGEEDR